MDMPERADAREAEMPEAQAHHPLKAQATHIGNTSRSFVQREPLYSCRDLPWSFLLTSEGRCNGSQWPPIEFRCR